MNQLKLTLLLLTVFLHSSCNEKYEDLKKEHAETIIENKNLTDSVTALNKKLDDYRLLLSFRSIKPMLIPQDTSFKLGAESKFLLVADVRNLTRNNKPYPLRYELSSNLETELKWTEDKRGWDHILTYKPLERGKDTINVKFYYQDPDSIESLVIPLSYPIEVK